MKFSRFALPLVGALCIFTAGCAPHPYYAPGPPPPPPPLIQQADSRGFRSGMDDGARDISSGYGYHPRRDRKYQQTPGYDPAFGPFGPYRDAFRRAYLRGYDQAFYRR